MSAVANNDLMANTCKIINSLASIIYTISVNDGVAIRHRIHVLETDGVRRESYFIVVWMSKYIFNVSFTFCVFISVKFLSI